MNRFEIEMDRLLSVKSEIEDEIFSLEIALEDCENEEEIERLRDEILDLVMALEDTEDEIENIDVRYSQERDERELNLWIDRGVF